MRGNLSLMLAASLALHLSVAAGIAVSCFYAPATPTREASATTVPSVLLVRSLETPAVTPRQTALAEPIPQATAAAIPATVPTQSLAAKTAPVALPPAALALETNPNAHVRPLPPESVLTPNPPPKLNGADGVVFLLDVSGSMYEPYAGSTRLAFARQALSRRLRALKDGTPFAITLYAQNACNSGPLVAANNDTREAAIRFIMRDVDLGGGTNLPAGFASAVQLHTGSLVLVTDGDWNMSASTILTQSQSILGVEGQCPALTIVGIAPRTAARDEPLMQGLADQQGGSYCAEQLPTTPELVTSAANVTKPASASR